MASSLIRGAHAIVVLGLLAGCGSPAPSAAPPTTGAPAVPDGWNVVTSDGGDVRLTLPPDVPPMSTAGGIFAQMPLTDGSLQLEVLVVIPADVFPQPGSGEDLGSWLHGSDWVPRAGDPGYVAITPAVATEVELSAGRALEMDVTVDPGLPNAARVVVYAIETGDGVAIIRFAGNPDVMEERAGELRVVAMFAEFGDLDEPR